MASKYTDDIKAQVLVDHQMGLSYNAIARKHKIPKPTVANWLNGQPALVDTSVIPQKDELGQLVYEYLKAGLIALTAQARQAATPGLIAAQGESLYLLHGVLADKVVLVLRGIERGGDDADVIAPADTEGTIVPG